MINRTHNKGFSLLEMLLTTMVVSGLLVAVFNLIEDYMEKQLAQNTADYMENIAMAVEDILSDPVHFQEAYNLADARPSNILELSLSDLVNGFGGVPASTRLNENIRNRTPLGAEIDVLMRISDNPSINTDSQSMEILVASHEPVILERARRAASAAGAYGGLLIDQADPIRSAFAGWRVNLASLAGTGWANAVSAEPPVENESAYLVHYRHVSFDESAGDYMFRVYVPGRPELNRMYTNLNMGTHNIMGADNLNLSGDLTLEGRAMVNGNMNVNGNVAMNQGDVIAGQRFSAGNVVVNGAGEGVRGNLTVDDSINISRVNLGGQLNAKTAELRAGVNSSGEITVDQLALQGGIGNAAQINATSLYGTGGSGPDLTIQGQMNAANYVTDGLNVQNGNVGTLDTIVEENAIVSGTVNSGNFGLNNVSVTTFGVCDKGC